jgi:hypothetical protein
MLFYQGFLFTEKLTGVESPSPLSSSEEEESNNEVSEEDRPTCLYDLLTKPGISIVSVVFI